LQGKEENMPEELARTKISRLRNTRVKNLKINIRKPKPLDTEETALKDGEFNKINPKMLEN
jgi:hypothetical protein